MSPARRRRSRSESSAGAAGYRSPSVDDDRIAAADDARRGEVPLPDGHALGISFRIGAPARPAVAPPDFRGWLVEVEAKLERRERVADIDRPQAAAVPGPDNEVGEG